MVAIVREPGRDERDAAVLEALELNHGEWLAVAYEAAHRAASESAMLTTNDIWPRVPWPGGPSGGRLMGQVMRHALREGWLGKDKVGGAWRVIDYLDLPPTRTLDGHLVRHQSRVGVYQSLIFPGSAGTP